MNLDINLKSINKISSQIRSFFAQYATLMFFVFVLSLYSFLVWQIGALSRAEPTDDQVAEQLKTAPRPKINQETLDKVQQLSDQNVAVESLFKSARDNPFQE